jgi:predicted DNA binding CopG/RHH family protein
MNRNRGTREFKTGAEGQGFWHIHDLNEYLDPSEANAASISNAKPSFTTVSLRLPESLLDQIKIEADKRDMPYQLLIQTWLAEAVEQSRRP